MKRKRVIINRLNVEQQNIGSEYVNSHLETSTIVNTREIPIERNKSIDVKLPFYKPDPPLNTEWHEYSGEQFVNLINSTYDDVIPWRKNLFKLPNDRASRLFINELSLWLDHFNRGMAFNCIAFLTFPCLPFQKPSPNSKAKDHVKKLEEKLKLWNEGNIEEVIQEARTIQNRFRNSTNSRRTYEDSARSFAKLMREGKVSEVLKMLSKDYDYGVLQLNKKVLEELKLKHLAPAEVKED